MIINFTKNNKPNTSRYIECFPFIGGPKIVRTIDLDQFLYDLDRQILILEDELYSVTNDDRGYDHEQGMQEYASVQGQITTLEMLRSQFDGF